jgi:hypothetical protein
VLQHFGDDFEKFSISRYIWNKIHDASEDPMRHLPYACYLMHVIKQVSGIRFPTDSNHKLLKISNKTSITAIRDMKKKAYATKAKGKGASSSHSRRGASPPAASRSSSAEPLSSSFSGKKHSKFKFLMTYMFGQCCASAQREHDMQERFYRLEQWAGIESSPPSPFVPPRDPLALYDEACVAYEDDVASRPHGKSKATDEDEDYIEDDDDDDGDDSDHDDDDDYEDE